MSGLLREEAAGSPHPEGPVLSLCDRWGWGPAGAGSEVAMGRSVVGVAVLGWGPGQGQ